MNEGIHRANELAERRRATAVWRLKAMRARWALAALKRPRFLCAPRSRGRPR